MEAVYGQNVSTRAVLSGKVAATESSERFLKAVRGAKAQANAAK
jgi:hypothetical protein